MIETLGRPTPQYPHRLRGRLGVPMSVLAWAVLAAAVTAAMNPAMTAATAAAQEASPEVIIPEGTGLPVVRVPLTRAGLADEGFVLRWDNTAPLRENGSGPIVELYLVGAMLVGRTSDNQLVAFEADTGRFRWMRRLGRPDRVTFPPTFNAPKLLPGGKPDAARLYVTNDDTVYELNAVTGEPLSVFALSFLPSSGFVREGTVAFIGGENNRLYFLDGQKGYRIENRVLPGYLIGNPLFDDADERGERAVAYVADTSGKVYAFQSSNRVLYWEFPPGKESIGKISGPLTRTPKSRSVDAKGVVSYSDLSLVFVPTDDNSLYALAKSSGKPRWQKRSNAAFREAAIPILGRQDSPIEQDRVYVRNAERILFAIDPFKGEDIWAMAKAGKLLCAARDPQMSIFLLNDEPSNPDFGSISKVINKPRIEDTPEGKRTAYTPVIKGKYQLGDLSVFVTNPDDPLLFASTRNGRVYCIKLGEGELRERLQAEKPPVVRVLTGVPVKKKDAEEPEMK